jgi:hypothetical protein
VRPSAIDHSAGGSRRLRSCESRRASISAGDHFPATSLHGQHLALSTFKTRAPVPYMRSVLLWQACQQPSCFTFSSQSWSTCSISCGWGVQTRRVFCALKASADAPVDDASCIDGSVGAAPPSQQNCNGGPCPVYSYGVKAWSACSVTCGTGGVQTRLTWCQSAPETPVPPVSCEAVGAAPPSTQPCASQQRCVYSFNSSDWGPCSTSCGSGVQTRKVHSARECALSCLWDGAVCAVFKTRTTRLQVYCAAAAGGSVADSLCGTDSTSLKPPSTQACAQAPCVFVPLQVNVTALRAASAAARRCGPLRFVETILFGLLLVVHDRI